MRFAILVFKIVGNHVRVMKINPFSRIFLWKDPKCFTTIYFSILFSRMKMKMRKPQSNNYLNFQFVYSLLFILQFVCLFYCRRHGWRSWTKSMIFYKAAFRSLKKQENGILKGLLLFKKKSCIFKIKTSIH